MPPPPPPPPLTLNTDQAERPSSPSPPPMSPLTPTLGPSEPATGASAPRQSFYHNQAPQMAVPPPAPMPIAFDSNPDVIALRSTISILQIQKMRATADIQALDKIKNEAVQDPVAFTNDLVAGKVGAGPTHGSTDSDDDESSGGASVDDAGKQSVAAPAERSWSTLPKAQNVVRCPPINWSKYAVVGESLDKLHAEQVARPTQGTPATIGANGTYEFNGSGSSEAYRGIAAPYDPLTDKIAKHSKGRR
jgi:hypothetical protein